MKAIKLFIFLTILGSVFLTSCSEEEYFDETTKSEVHMRNPNVAGPGSGSSDQPPCSDEVSIWVQGNYWSDVDNTTCPDADPITLEAVGFGSNDVITWDIQGQGATLLANNGTTAVVGVPGTDTYLWFRATNQSGLSACKSARVITDGRCFFSTIDFCNAFPNHPNCEGNGIGGME